jgi:transposase-like protein
MRRARGGAGCDCYGRCSSGAGLEDWWLPIISTQAGIRMDLHKNARTTPHSRLLMVRRVLEQKQPATKIAADFGVSERTVRKWLAWWRAGGEPALKDRSLAPARRRRRDCGQPARVQGPISSTLRPHGRAHRLLHNPPLHRKTEATSERQTLIVSSRGMLRAAFPVAGPATSTTSRQRAGSAHLASPVRLGSRSPMREQATPGPLLRSPRRECR